MSEIAGASRYLNQAIYSAKAGSTFTPENILSQSGLSGDLLSAASSLRINGFGVSGSARSLNQQLLNNSSTVNEMFSLSGGAAATVEAAQIQIKGLQATAIASRLTPELRAQIVDQVENGTSAADSSTGGTLDTEA